MAQGLQKQVIEVDFGDGGIDTKTQKKLVDSRHLISAVNVQYNDKLIRKRNGTKPTFSGTQNFTLSRLFNTDNWVAGLANQSIYVPDNSGTFSQGPPFFSLPNATSLDVFRGVATGSSNSGAVYSTDSVTVQNPTDGHFHTVYVWADASGVANVSVVDRTTGAVVVRPTGLFGGATFGCKVALSDAKTAVIALYSVGTVVLNTYVAGTGLALTTATVAGVTGEFDITKAAGVVAIAYYTSATNIRIATITTAGALTGTTNNVTVIGANHLCLAVDPQTSTKIQLYWVDGTTTPTSVKGITFNSSLVVQNTTFTVATGFTVSTINRLCALDGTTAAFTYANYVVMVEVSATASYNSQVRMYSGPLGSAGTLTLTRRSLQIGSKPFVHGTGDFFILLWYVSSLQGTYLLHQFHTGYTSPYELLSPVAKILGTVANSTIASSNVPTLASVDGTTKNFAAGVTKINRLVSVGGSLVGISGAAEVLFSAPSTAAEWATRAQSVIHNQATKLTGGFLGTFDGRYLFENGFMIYPESPTLAQGAGGGLADGTYQVALVYESIDSKGNICESNPSVTTSIVISAGGGTATIVATAPTSRVGIRSLGLVRNCTIAMYVSDANAPNVLYRCTDPTSPTVNDSTVDTKTITCSLSNAQLISRQTLYTTGGVLPNFNPDSPSLIFQCQQNIFIDDPNDPTIMRYSKLQTAGYELAFSDQFTVKIPADGGRIVAGCELDTKAVFFKSSSIYVSYGSGLGDTGQGQGFAAAQRIRSDVGCVGAGLLCEIPQGILFRSAKGIYLLGRDLNIIYAGDAVESYNSSSIRSWVNVKNQNEVRIALDDDNTVLVYNYERVGPDGVGRWSIWTNYGQNSAVLDTSGNYTFAANISGRSVVYQENVGVFSDTHTSGSIPANIVSQIVTPWYKFANLSGFLRCWKAFLYMSTQPRPVKVEPAYDYEEGVYSEVHNISTPTGSTQYVPWFQPIRSRNQAMQLRITDSQAGTTIAGDFQISGLGFEVGSLPGAGRYPSSNSA